MLLSHQDYGLRLVNHCTWFHQAECLLPTMQEQDACLESLLTVASWQDYKIKSRPAPPAGPSAQGRRVVEARTPGAHAPWRLGAALRYHGART